MYRFAIIARKTQSTTENSSLDGRNERFNSKLAYLSANAIQSTSTLRTLVKIINWKRRRSNPNRKINIISVPSNLHNVEPQEQHFDADPGQAREFVFGYVAADLGFVFELVRSFEGETARAVQVSVELAGLSVYIVLRDALWEETRWEVVRLEDVVG